MKKLLILLILIGIITLSGCVGQLTIEKTTTTLSYKSECPEEELKDYIKTGLTRTGSFYYSDSMQNGYEICWHGTAICNVGNVEGQNINYNYCSPQLDAIFCFKKTIVNSTGIIEKVIVKCINQFVYDLKTKEVISVNCIDKPTNLPFC
jgi:hypothetical protein